MYLQVFIEVTEMLIPLENIYFKLFCDNSYALQYAVFNSLLWVTIRNCKVRKSFFMQLQLWESRVLTGHIVGCLPLFFVVVRKISKRLCLSSISYDSSYSFLVALVTDFTLTFLLNCLSLYLWECLCLRYFATSESPLYQR